MNNYLNSSELGIHMVERKRWDGTCIRKLVTVLTCIFMERGGGLAATARKEGGN